MFFIGCCKLPGCKSSFITNPSFQFIVFATFAAAGRFIVLTFTVSKESPGNAGRRAS